jgi:hypothetical protein
VRELRAWTRGLSHGDGKRNGRICDGWRLRVCNEWDNKAFVKDSIRDIEGDVYNYMQDLQLGRPDAFHVRWFG